MKPFAANTSKPPLRCAGRKQLRGEGQARLVGQRLQCDVTYCRFCGCYHTMRPWK